MQRETLFFQKFNLLCSISLIVFFTQTLAQVAQSCRVQFWCHFHLCCCGLLPRRASPLTCQLKKNKACLNQSMGIIEDKMSISFPCRSLMVLTWSLTLVVQCIYENPSPNITVIKKPFSTSQQESPIEGIGHCLLICPPTLKLRQWATSAKTVKWEMLLQKFHPFYPEISPTMSSTV